MITIISSVLITYLLAAVLPAIILMAYVYHMDSFEKEPPRLLLQLCMGGVGAGLLAIFLEQISQGLLNRFVGQNNPYYVISLAFLGVALVEEGVKFAALKWISWKSPSFNYRFDGIVYAVFVSLGFAAFENIGYVIGYGLTVAPLRALLAVPGHLSFAVVEGFFYGRARRAENLGYHSASVTNQVLGLVAAILLHGIYDSCAMIGTTAATIIFIVFVAVLYLSVYYLIHRESRRNRPL